MILLNAVQKHAKYGVCFCFILVIPIGFPPFFYYYFFPVSALIFIGWFWLAEENDRQLISSNTMHNATTTVSFFFQYNSQGPKGNLLFIKVILRSLLLQGTKFLRSLKTQTWARKTGPMMERRRLVRERGPQAFWRPSRCRRCWRKGGGRGPARWEAMVEVEQVVKANRWCSSPQGTGPPE